MFRNSRLILGFVMVVMFAVFAVTFALHCGVKAADAEVDDKMNCEVMERIYILAKREFVENFNDETFFNGAFEAIGKLLEDERIEHDRLPELTFDGDMDKEEMFSVFEKELGEVVDKYKSEEWPEEELLNVALNGMLDTLEDPYTVYLNSKDYDRLNESMSGGNFTGVGIYIELNRDNNNQLTVVEPIEGTPVYTAGLKSGDAIIKIDGNPTRGIGLDDAVSQIRGPEGSEVLLTIQRRDVDEPIDFTIKRDFIHVNSVVAKLLDGNVGYLKLRIFGDETNREIDQAMTDLEKDGAKAFILDLRNNGGGYVTAAVDVSSKFLEEGTDIVSIKDRYGGKNRYKSYGTVHPDYPLVILVNDFSASASEITAGAIKDAQRGTLIGTKTFGKGSVQTIFPLDKGGAIKITTAHYFTPRGRNINDKGIKPDIIVEMDEDLIDTEEDIQLDEAVKFLKEKIAEKDSVS